MSNRAMRRAVARSNHQFLTQMDRNAKKAALIRNGITPEDLEKNYRIGYDEGFSAGGRPARADGLLLAGRCRGAAGEDGNQAQLGRPH